MFDSWWPALSFLERLTKLLGNIWNVRWTAVTAPWCVVEVTRWAICLPRILHSLVISGPFPNPAETPPGDSWGLETVPVAGAR